MTAFLELDGQRAISGRVTVPYYGVWVADITLALPDTVPTNTTLTVGNFVAPCTVFRSAPFAGTRSARVVGGAGGWRKPLAKQSYYSPNGVKVSTVIRDAAGQVGETVSVSSAVDGVIGNHYARPDLEHASDLLRAVAGDEWWLDPKTGTTFVGSRTGVAIGTPFNAIKWSGGKGWFDVATEDVAAWMPGNTFENSLVPTTTISLTEISFDNKGVLRISVLSADVSD